MAVTIKLQTYHILYNKIRPASKRGAPGEIKKKENKKEKSRLLRWKNTGLQEEEKRVKRR